MTIGQLDRGRVVAPRPPADDVIAPPASAGSGVTRLAGYFERACDRTPAATALECDGQRLSYAELDQRANRLADHLIARGVTTGSRVGILLTRSVEMYTALLGTTKTEATFVPIDPAVPADRLAYIAEDADLDLVLTTTHFAASCVGLSCPAAYLDELAGELAGRSGERPRTDHVGDPVCYVLYTSGSSGRPKGVEIAQSSICNFIGVVPALYGVQPADRVYQGMTIAFDFSVEEIWPTWAVGATLVAGPTDGRRVGSGLAEFLEQQRITMIYCVPTVLATLDRTLPLIRTVNVGGEACPRELVDRWGPGRRILNTYGPTETTVTCTMAELHPGRPVTIGRPLPTYRVTLLDDDRRPVRPGEVGEICVGGPGVARGYVKRPDLTADRFIPDPRRPGERIYRTGDLGRFLPDGELEYLGRADSEVKVRGHRVDLQEIEGVLLEHEGVTAAVVRLVDTPGTGGELAGYLIPRDVAVGDLAAATRLTGELHEQLGRRLPGYMVPTYLDVVDAIPMLPSGKADRNNLPEPRGPRLVRTGSTHVAPSTRAEAWIAGVWEETLRLPAGSLSVAADFFADLGGHSLLAARVVSALREQDLGAGLSILDLYRHPTVGDLAAFLESSSGDGDAEQREERRGPPPRGRVTAFGAVQVAWLYALLQLFALPITGLFVLHRGVLSLTLALQLALITPVTYLLGRWLLPLAGIRLLSRGLRTGDHPVWGATHLRVWTVRTLVQMSPLAVLSGSPWAIPYLRLAGAQIDDEAHVCTADVALPSLLRVERGATIGNGTQLHAYHIADGVLTVRPLTIGSGAVVGSQCVLEAGSEVGEGAILRDVSQLQEGHRVPAGEVWAGSPARPTPEAVDPVLELMSGCAAARRTWSRRLLARFAGGVLLLEVLLPFLVLLPVVVLVLWSLLTAGVVGGLVAAALSGPVFVAATCGVVLGFRRRALPVTPPGVHHLRSRLGAAKWLADKLLETSLLLTNTMYCTLYTPHWLRALGSRIGKGTEVSTIANIDPDLLTLGNGSFVADMASVGSATYANGHVAFLPTVVGDRAFVGNAAFMPCGSHLGDGSLIGVRTVPPAEGTAPGSSWLGSPPFYLPRRERYEEFTEEQTFSPSPRRVRERYAIEFLRIVLPGSLLTVAAVATLCGSLALASTGSWPLTAFLAPPIAVVSGLAVVLFVALLKWVVVGRYRPRVRPLWSGFVRRTEFVTGIYEGAAVPALLVFLTGTPLLGPALRLFGARIGRRTLLDTTFLTEFDLVALGDDVVVGSGTSLQTHLFEDRVMKMDHVVVRDRASVGARSVVLYGSQVEQDAVLASLSLVMKGEMLPAGTAWSGIPAQRVSRAPVAAVAAPRALGAGEPSSGTPTRNPACGVPATTGSTTATRVWHACTRVPRATTPGRRPARGRHRAGR